MNFARFQSKEDFRPAFGDLLFPLSDAAFNAQSTDLAYTAGRFLDDFKEAFVVFGVVGVNDLLKELIKTLVITDF